MTDASPPTRADPRVEFARNLEAARTEAGRREGRELKYSALQKEMASTFGRYVPTAQSVADYHHGRVSPEGSKLEWVEWFAERYGIAASSLSPIIAERIGPARTLLSRSRCFTPTAFGRPLRAVLLSCLL